MFFPSLLILATFALLNITLFATLSSGLGSDFPLSAFDESAKAF